MSSVVLGVGASHSTLMNTNWDQVEHLDRAERFRSALGEAAHALAEARPDVVVIVGSNHFRGLWLDLMPAFTLGVGEVIASGESGTPEGPQATDPAFARHLLDSLVADDFDVAFSLRMQIDHGITHAIQYLLTELGGPGPGGVPVVPLVVNMFAPPLPSLPRCARLGEALGRAIAADGADRRVAVIASGGLSHRLPWPDWQEPQSDDDEFMVQAWLNGRGSWQDYDARRRQIIRAAPADLNPTWDHEVLGLLEAGRFGEVVRYDDARLVLTAGNGANEIRSWLVMASACGHGPGRVLAYEELPEWLTGMGVALVTPTPAPIGAPA